MASWASAWGSFPLSPPAGLLCQPAYQRDERRWRAIYDRTDPPIATDASLRCRRSATTSFAAAKRGVPCLLGSPAMMIHPGRTGQEELPVYCWLTSGFANNGLPSVRPMGEAASLPGPEDGNSDARYCDQSASLWSIAVLKASLAGSLECPMLSWSDEVKL